MVEGYQYLQNISASFRRQIMDGRLDEVITDVGLALWRMEECLDRVPSDVVQVAEDMLERVHGRVLRGADSEALTVLAALEAQLAELESKSHGRPA